MLIAHQENIALGSKTEIVLVADAEGAAVSEIFRRLWLVIFTFERSFSRFLPSSELSQFNRAAGSRQPISQEFQSILRAAVRLAANTGGMYNPFILPALQRVGYVHSMVAAHKHDEVDDYSGRSVVASDQLEVGETWARIPYGTAIDLGGCGKGYLGDLLADIAEATQGLTGYYISIGGDIVAGGQNSDGYPWTIGIERSANPDGTAAGLTVTPKNGYVAVATSSVIYRKGVKDRKPWHHIIDPRTNLPAKTSNVTASVCANSGITADVLASCMLMLDTDEAIKFAEEKGASGLLLQSKTGRISYWGDIHPTSL